MQPWFFFTLLSVIAMACDELSQKVALTQKANISAITNNFFVWTLQGVGGLLIAGILGQFSFTLTSIQLIKLLVVAFVYFLGGTLFYTSYKGNSPSISIVLGSVSVIVSTTLGIIFFQEGTSLNKFVGIALVLFAIVIANIQKKDRFNRFNLLALFGGICFGIAYTLDKSFALQLPPGMYVALLCFSVAIVSIVLRGKHIISEAKPLKLHNFYPMFASATFGTLFNFFTFKSYGLGGNVGVVDAMNNANVFLVILMEILLLRDRSNLTKKIIAAGLVGAGIWLLSGI